MPCAVDIFFEGRLAWLEKGISPLHQAAQAKKLMVAHNRARLLSRFRLAL
jgi:hypothetical protein